ncbi:radical SAM family heme chaperone HemW [Aureibacter tunicatorum]|uniref:Heme chaperone HemW n=1 Tax=Aureibacter tunicatorum TaxID=866807 RepID=A0AAE3XK14_9BACT|nr:radical SAM family heme chaperone HemW [Aureibacter tunicatorum]MDR6237211.1 oxygen-independent coproporphyrinogen-3 oxidase [Aureibacter tunicatorum]BDD06203.1 coproporphyrinogen III oxidase [Aureibacter tunicatorum]
MAGIYIHIPFCKKACHYCDFHFSTSLKLKEKMVEAIIAETILQKNFLGNEQVETIYFGGGTPSILDVNELESILNKIIEQFSISSKPEITLEANPDDLSISKLKDIKSLGINRLSIGIQSFNDNFLTYLNRSHNSTEAKSVINNAQHVGFENISIDLIYAIPNDDHKIWKEDLSLAMSLNVPHISPYSLTIEEKTVFGNWLKRNKINEVEDNFAAEQFEILQETLFANNYEQYEISNFAREKAYSKHNTNYWRQKKYLGLGPGAHSFNGNSRQFNVLNNPNYINSISKGIIPSTSDDLDLKDQTNEYILTSLRTIWGIDLNFLKNRYQYSIPQKAINQYLNSGHCMQKDNSLMLTKPGRLFADKIACDFFTT